MNDSETDISSFVSWILSWLALGCYLFWICLPDNLFKKLGIIYYPNRIWGIILPIYFIFLIILSILVYNALCLLNTRPLNSHDLISDDITKINLSPISINKNKVRSITHEWITNLYNISDECNKRMCIYEEYEEIESNTISKINNYGNSKESIREYLRNRKIPSSAFYLQRSHKNDQINLSMREISSIADIPLPLVCDILYGN
ncbi:putative phosphatidylinositol-glycan biosynthesis class P protein [Cryptosporidium serpentis]